MHIPPFMPPYLQQLMERQVASSVGAPVPAAIPPMADLQARAAASVPENGTGERLRDGSMAARPSGPPPNWGAMITASKPLGGQPQGFNLQQALAQSFQPDFGRRISETGALPDGQGIADALQRNAELGKEKRGKIPLWAAALGILSDAFIAAGGGTPQFGPMVARRREIEQQQEFEREKWAQQLEAERQKRLLPRPEQVGSTIGIFDPSDLTFNQVWREPTEPEQYAASLGYEPGTEAFANAMREYRAGTWNPVGVQGRLTVQAPRLETTRRGQDLTHSDRVRGQDISRDNNIRSTSQSDVNSRRSAETTRGAYSYSHGGRSAGRKPTNEAVAVGPDGKRYVVRNGKWVPIQ